MQFPTSLRENSEPIEESSDQRHSEPWFTVSSLLFANNKLLSPTTTATTRRKHRRCKQANQPRNPFSLPESANKDVDAPLLPSISEEASGEDSSESLKASDRDSPPSTTKLTTDLPKTVKYDPATELTLATQRKLNSLPVKCKAAILSQPPVFGSAIIDFADTMISHSNILRKRRDRLACFSQHGAEKEHPRDQTAKHSPYIPKNAQIKTSLSRSSALKDDELARAYIRKMKELNRKYMMDASDLNCKMALLESDAAQHNRLNAFVEGALKLFTMYARHAIFAHPNKTSTKRNMLQLGGAILLRYIRKELRYNRKELPDEYFANYLFSTRGTVTKSILHAITSDRSLDRSLRKIEESEQLAYSFVCNAMNTFFVQITYDTYVELGEQKQAQVNHKTTAKTSKTKPDRLLDRLLTPTDQSAQDSNKTTANTSKTKSETPPDPPKIINVHETAHDSSEPSSPSESRDWGERVKIKIDTLPSKRGRNRRSNSQRSVGIRSRDSLRSSSDRGQSSADMHHHPTIKIVISPN